MWASRRADLGDKDYIPFAKLVGFTTFYSDFYRTRLMSKFLTFILRSSLMRKKPASPKIQITTKRRFIKLGDLPIIRSAVKGSFLFGGWLSY